MPPGLSYKAGLAGQARFEIYSFMEAVMKVRDCMSTHVISVGEFESADVAARLMARYNLGSLPVRRFDGSLCGMVTDRDLVVRCIAADRSAGSVRVGSVMTRRVIRAQAGQDVLQAARTMAREQVRRLPVTQQGQLVGVLTLADVSRREELCTEAGECLGEICAPVRHLD